MHPWFDFGFVPIYPIMLFVALLTGYISYKKAFKKKFYSKFIYKRIKSSVNKATFCGLLGANLINWIIHDEIMNYSLFHRLTQGGYSFYFGMLTFFGVLALLFRIKGIGLKFGLNKIVPSILIAQFIARLGCCFAGCCWGDPVSLFGLDFLFPARELEVIFALVLFIVLSKVKALFEHRLKVYLFSYSLFRFLTEFLRGDDRGTLFDISFLTPTQIVSLFVILISAVMLFARPIFKGLGKEELIDKIKEKVTGIFETVRQKVFKKEKPYAPYPINYPGPDGKKKKVFKIITIITSIILVIAILIMYLNPFSSTFREWVNDGVVSLFQDKGTENEIAEANGINLVDVSDQEKVTKKSEAVSLIKKCDNWKDFDYKVISDKKLPNGNKMYVFAQVIKEKPVIGKNRVLVTDADDNPLYVAGDTATLAFADEKSTTFSNNNMTIKEAFGDKAQIIEKMDCWYDTTEGLIEAYHAILSDDGETPIIGVVVQKDNDRIICTTKPILGMLSNNISNTIDISSKVIADFINNNNVEELEKIEDSDDSEISDFEKLTRAFEKTLCEIYNKCKFVKEWFIDVLETVNEISTSVSDINLDMYREIFVEETIRTLGQKGFDAKESENIVKQLKKIMKRNGIKQDTDEAVVALDSESGKTSFKYSINFDNDVDTFNVTVKPNSITEFTVDSETPIRAEIYTIDGGHVVSMYIEEEETISLYPEDGCEFVVRIADVVKSDRSTHFEADYKISMNSTLIEKEIPKDVVNTISLVEKSYDNSIAVAFYGIYAPGGEKTPAENALGSTVLSIFNDWLVSSCSTNCTGAEYDVDTAKSMIATEIVRESKEYTEQFTMLKDTDLELTYINHIEMEEYTAVKLRTRITRYDLDIYNGYTFMKLEHIDDSQVQLSETEQQISNLVDMFLGDTYFITEINSESLYDLFGDTPDDIKPTNDITSLYDLWIPEEENINGVTISVMTLDKEKAARNGHSAEKIADFEQYTARHNVMKLKEYRAGFIMQEKMFTVITTCADPTKFVIDLVTDPFGTLAGNLFARNEFTNVLWTLYSIYDDAKSFAVDLVIDELINSSKDMLVEVRADIEEVNARISKYEAMLV